jgi:hypothetical protein
MPFRIRWAAATLAVLAVATLAAYGAKPEGSEAVNNGHRPAPGGHAARVDRNVRRRNHGAEVRCVRRTIPDNSGVSTWECNVRLKGFRSADALVEVITGDGLPYGIAECRSTTPNICNLIH